MTHLVREQSIKEITDIGFGFGHQNRPFLSTTTHFWSLSCQVFFGCITGGLENRRVSDYHSIAETSTKNPVIIHNITSDWG
jgi:hypothetical protein